MIKQIQIEQQENQGKQDQAQVFIFYQKSIHQTFYLFIGS
jgi:hypothetical protein